MWDSNRQLSLFSSSTHLPLYSMTTQPSDLWPPKVSHLIKEQLSPYVYYTQMPVLDYIIICCVNCGTNNVNNEVWLWEVSEYTCRCDNLSWCWQHSYFLGQVNRLIVSFRLLCCVVISHSWHFVVCGHITWLTRGRRTNYDPWKLDSNRFTVHSTDVAIFQLIARYKRYCTHTHTYVCVPFFSHAEADKYLIPLSHVPALVGWTCRLQKWAQAHAA